MALEPLPAALLLLPWLSLSAVSLWMIGHYRRDWALHTAQAPPLPSPPPPAAIILPATGDSPLLRASFDAFAALDYPDYRLVIAVASADDPAYAPACALAQRRPARVSVIVAGRACVGAQKITNQLAAWAAIPAGAQVICCADADTLPAPDWLTCLVRWTRLAPDRVLVSGYRWMVPADERLPTRVVCSINAGIATLARSRRWNLAWGGAMAADRALWDRLDPRAALGGVASDDLVLSRVVRERGGYVEQVRDLLVIAPVSMTWARCGGFLRRQYTMLWLYAPRYWVLAAAVTAGSALGWVAALGLIAMRGGPWPWIALIMVVGMDAARLALQWRFAVQKWGDGGIRVQSRGRLWQSLLSLPLVAVWHALCVWTTLARRRFEWAGIMYDARDAAAVRIVARAARD